MSSCWSCAAAAPADELFCPSCGALQPAPAGGDHFAALGLPRSYALDPAELERHFRDRSRLLHPDRFARKTPRERRLSLERSTRLNDAYRTLREPRARAAYLLKLLGRDPQAEARTLHDPEFLEEQLAAREELAEARAEGDARRLALLATGARDRLRALEEEVACALGPAAPGPEALDTAVRALVRARYYENVASEAEGSPRTHG
ncbi:MAG TPA: Fe-S protein assembly co-chaperone HscB [Anaeromyxobacteraceae bacterium]|nr:Fe-S protein assembly co-chaperone HscB [Anaeromyxobacteraceae bacterium]